MKKIFLIIIALFIITGCSNKIENTSNEIENTSNEIEDVNEVMDSMVIVINDNEYIVNLEDNETVKSFLKMLPLELNMNELNGNEKYFSCISLLFPKLHYRFRAVSLVGINSHEVYNSPV